jgi:hypothetical protein
VYITHITRFKFVFIVGRNFIIDRSVDFGATTVSVFIFYDRQNIHVLEEFSLVGYDDV